MELWAGAVLLMGVMVALRVLADARRTGIPPTPSSARQRAAVVAQVASLPVEGAVFELGAGFGGLAVALADQLAPRTVVAFELAWLPWVWLRVRQRFAPRRNLLLRREDFQRASLQGAGVLVTYTCRQQMRALAERLAAAQVHGGDRYLVSHTFALPGWTPWRVAWLDDLHRSPLYVYRWGRETEASSPEV